MCGLITTQATTGNPNISVPLTWRTQRKRLCVNIGLEIEVIEGINFNLRLKIGYKRTDSYHWLCISLHPSFTFHIIQRLFPTIEDTKATCRSIL